MADLRGKVALVTQAGSAAGRGAAEGLAEAGCGLWLVDDDLGHEGEVTLAAVEALGGRATLAGAALQDAGAVARLLTRIYGEEGRLDIVVNVHGDHVPALDAVPTLLEDGGGLLIELLEAQAPLAGADASVAPGSAVTQLVLRTTASATPRYAGRCIAALAMDPDVAEKHAGAFDIGTLAAEYRFSELEP